MSSSVRTVTKALAGEEDLLYTEDTVQQTRGDSTVTINGVRGFRPVNSQAELEDLDPAKFPKIALVINGLLEFKQWDGTQYTALTRLHKVANIPGEPTTISALGLDIIVLDPQTTHAITGITDGVNGQRIRIVSKNGNTTISEAGNIRLKFNANFNIVANTGVTLLFLDGIWCEV